MSLAQLYNKTVSTERLSSVSGSMKETWAANLASVPCTIHPIDTRQNHTTHGAFYKSYKMWCAVDEDIVIGDRVIDGDVTYTVQGVSTYDFGASNHLMLMLVTK